jgi:hypothetical protein
LLFRVGLSPLLQFETTSKRQFKATSKRARLGILRIEYCELRRLIVRADGRDEPSVEEALELRHGLRNYALSIEHWETQHLHKKEDMDTWTRRQP